MPTSTDNDTRVPLSILAIGYPGSGKSTQYMTLPGRKFAYVFEKHALLSVREANIPHAAFLPTHKDVNMAIKTLKKGHGDSNPIKQSAMEPTVYNNWLTHFTEWAEGGKFDDIDWLIVDSFTTFSYSVMDRILWLNKRMGFQPQQDDWGAQVQNITDIWRVLSAIGCNIYCTAHLEARKNDVTGRTYNHLMMTGQLRTRIPLLFSNIWGFAVDTDKEGAFYTVQTVSDRETPNIRSSVKGLDQFEDVTLDFDKPLEGQGVAALLARGARAKAAAGKKGAKK